jgi:hypothetical protein
MGNRGNRMLMTALQEAGCMEVIDQQHFKFVAWPERTPIEVLIRNRMNNPNAEVEAEMGADGEEGTKRKPSRNRGNRRRPPRKKEDGAEGTGSAENNPEAVAVPASAEA